jgi:hypothetical protein
LSLPQLAEFPDSKALLEVHQDLSQFERLTQGVAKGAVPALADSSQDTLALAHTLVADIEVVKRLQDEIVQFNRPWTTALREQLRRNGNVELLLMLEALGAELEQAVELRKGFIERPVNAPKGIELDTELTDAVRNLAVGKSPFGLKGLFGKAVQKKQLEMIRIFGNSPADVESWKHVAKYLELLVRLRSLAFRWNALARELQLDPVSEDDPEGGVAAAQEYSVFFKEKCLVKRRQILDSTVRYFLTVSARSADTHD